MVPQFLDKLFDRYLKRISGRARRVKLPTLDKNHCFSSGSIGEDVGDVGSLPNRNYVRGVPEGNPRARTDDGGPRVGAQCNAVE